MQQIIIVGALSLITALHSACSATIDCALVRCADPGCDYPISAKRVKGQCCPTCPVAVCIGEDGKKYKPGDSVPNDDPCSHCTCQDNGKITCFIQDCAAPPCDNYVRVEGKCCPVCPPPGYCIATDGTLYTAGDDVPSEDPCHICTCGSDSHISCATFDCPLLSCKNPVSAEGKCCPSCPRPDVCVKDGVKYEVGQPIPASNACFSCFCGEGGKIACSIQDCAHPPCDAPVSIPGQCCPVCPKIEFEIEEPMI